MHGIPWMDVPWEEWVTFYVTIGLFHSCSQVSHFIVIGNQYIGPEPFSFYFYSYAHSQFGKNEFLLFYTYHAFYLNQNEKEVSEFFEFKLPKYDESLFMSIVIFRHKSTFADFRRKWKTYLSTIYVENSTVRITMWLQFGKNMYESHIPK